MKKSLKVLLVLCFLIVALMGCILDDEEDENANVVIQTASLASLKISTFNTISSSTISKANYDNTYIFEYALKLKNEGKASANGITYSVALYKGDTKIYDLASKKEVNTIEAGKIEPSADNTYLTSGKWSTTIKNIPAYDNGTYKMVFQISNGVKKEIEFTITN